MRPDVADFYNGISFDCYRLLGAHPAGAGRGWCFTVYAPHAQRVQAVGDWNAWALYQPTELYCCEDGLWRGRAPTAQNEQLYKYNILGADGVWRLRPDPFAMGGEALPGTASRLVTPDYAFGDAAWLHRRGSFADAPMNIYELHAGAWRRHWNGSYYSGSELAQALIPYLQAHHYTHAEFLPMAEHPFDGSWGYQGSGYFSPSARYGGLTEFCALVDSLHAAGLGVLMDFVPVHFAPDPDRLANFDGAPLFEAPGAAQQSDWGSLNFDLGSGAVRSFLLSAAAFWLHICHCDGLRVDAVGNALYRPLGGDAQTAAEFFKTLTGGLHARCPGTVLVAEDTAGVLNATAPTVCGGLGFDAVWDLAFAQELLACFAAPYDARGWHCAKLVQSMDGFYAARRINALSHDDNAWGTGTVYWRLYGGEQEKLAQARLLYLLQYTRPGKKLNFMGNEFAQPRAFDVYRELDWGVLAHPGHKALADYCAALGALYAAHPALHCGEYDPACFAWAARGDAAQGVFGWLRKAGGEVLLCAFNLAPAPLHAYGFDLRCLHREVAATPVFAAGTVGDATLYSQNGWLTLSLPGFGGVVLHLQ